MVGYSGSKDNVHVVQKTASIGQVTSGGLGHGRFTENDQIFDLFTAAGSYFVDLSNVEKCYLRHETRLVTVAVKSKIP